MSPATLELLSMPTCFGVFVTLLVSGAILAIQLGQYAVVRGHHHVRGTIVDFENRWDESYQRNDPIPVVEVMLPTGPARATIESGYMRMNGAPTMKEREEVWVYVDPKTPDEARMLMPWALTLLLGPAIGLVVFVMLLVTMYFVPSH